VETGGRFLRVQVKSTSCQRSKHYVCAIDGREKKPCTAADIDFFAIYVIPADSWYIIPIEESSSAIGSSPHNSLSQNACYKEAWHLLQRERTAWTGSVRTMQLRRTGVSALHAAEGTRATPPHRQTTTTRGAFVLACVAVQRLHQAFQAALIEFIIARLGPGLGFWAVPINDLSHPAEMFFNMKAVENRSGLRE
jgi:hypothetical protein